MRLSKNPIDSAKTPNRLRAAVFHVMAVLVVFSPLLVIEILLRWFAPPAPLQLNDPYVSFSGIHPLFVLNESKTHYETAKERLTFFRHQSFPASKKPGTFRIFCLGGSTVQGRPYSVETSFTNWLQLNLQAVQPDQSYEIINCGGISYASHRLVPIMRELLLYEPDLFIVYTGQNEFLEDRTYQPITKFPRFFIRTYRTLLSLRSFSLAHQLIIERRTAPTSPAKTILPAEVQAKLDFNDGLASYHRDDNWHEGVFHHFRHNLETMIRLSQSRNVPLILMNPVSNLKDCPPFKSETTRSLSGPQIKQVTGILQQTRQIDWSRAQDKIDLLKKAVETDPRNAEILYLMGKCFERLGRYVEAKQWFIKAKEEDVCPLRCLEPMNQIIKETAALYNIPLVDITALIEERTEYGIPGREWLLDHVHPNIQGHRLMADALLECMETMNLVQRKEGWKSMRDELWRKHQQFLNEAYYEKGLMRLERVRNWSRGRVPKALWDEE